MPTTTKYIWDEQNYLAEADGANTIHVVYTHELQQYGNLISTCISENVSYHHFDVIGSTRQLTNTATHVTDNVTYDAWGNSMSRTGSTPVFQLWIGQVGYYSDIETGLLYVRARSCSSLIGRWTSVDPVAQSIHPDDHLYLYASANPIRFVDPSGLEESDTDNDCPACQTPEIYTPVKLATSYGDFDLTANVLRAERSRDNNYTKLIRKKKDELKDDGNQITVIVDFDLYKVKCCKIGDEYQSATKVKIKVTKADTVRTELLRVGVPTPPGPANKKNMRKALNYAFPFDCWINSENKCLREAGPNAFCPRIIATTTLL